MNLRAPFAGTVVAVPHAIDEAVSAGTPLIVLEAMKMEHELLAGGDGTLEQLEVGVGDTVSEGQLLAVLRPADANHRAPQPRRRDPERSGPRDDLRAVRERHAIGLDHARPEAVSKRHDSGRRTARENLHELLDDGSFVEYGPLMFAAQERRRAKQELIERTPADGLVGGVGAIDGEDCVAMSYDYTVLAGHPGDAQPPQEGPAVRARAAPPAASGPVRRGRRWPPRGRRHADRRGAGLPRLSPVRQAQRAGAVGRDSVGLLLCRQRGAAGLLRRRDRQRGLEHRDGRTGDDRGRRVGRPRPPGRRSDRCPVRQRSRGSASGRRRAGGSRRQALPGVLRAHPAGCPSRRRRPGRPAARADHAPRPDPGQPQAHLRDP